MQTLRFFILVFLVETWNKKLITFHVIHLLLQIIMREEDLWELVLIFEVLSSLILISLFGFLNWINEYLNIFN